MHANELSRKRKYNNKNKEKRKKHYTDNSNLYFDRRLRSMYGVSLEWYNAKLIEQNYVCAICFKPPTARKHVTRLSVDHNHETGEVRGLLCNTCNPQLPIIEEVNRLKQALMYLKKYNNNEVYELKSN